MLLNLSFLMVKLHTEFVQADFLGYDRVLELETQEIDGNNEHVSTVFLEESLTSQLESLTLPEHRKRDNDSISIITEKKLWSYFGSVEKHFMKTKNNLNGVISSKSTTESGNLKRNFYTDMLKKKQILDLKKQLFQKNAVIYFLTSQIISKSLNTFKNKNVSNNNNHEFTNSNNKYNHHNTPMERLINDEARKVIIIRDSMLNSINSQGLSEKVEVLNFPVATSNNIVRKTDDGLHQKPELLVAHVETNDLTNEINLLNNIKILSPKQSKKNSTLY